MHNSSQMLEAITRGLEIEGGHLSFHFDEKKRDWLVAAEFGRETPDSDMAGGASYQQGPILSNAMEALIEECGWFRLLDWVKDPRTNEWRPPQDPAKIEAAGTTVLGDDEPISSC